MKPCASAADPFWAGFGLDACPDFSGKSILEIGCGNGWRCIQAAEHGARRALGVDPIESSIAEAHANVARSELGPRAAAISFFCGTIDQLPPEQFDVAISESALEHVMDVPALLSEVRRRLKPGGRFYLGFGPLYHAFDGDHGWLRATLPFRRLFAWPWGHLFFERYAMRRLSEIHGRPITRTYDWPYLDLNRLALADYRRIFGECGMRIVCLRSNQVRSLKARALSALAHFPGLSKFFTVNMYVVFEPAQETG